MVEELDLRAILDTYVEDKGFPPFHPAMMTGLLLYAYMQGVFSSRKIAKACIERMDFAAVTGFQKPDFRTISLFRKRHLAGMAARHIRTYIATGRQKHGTEAATHAKNGKPGSLIAAMRDKLKRGGWRSPYRLRKQVVEPVFGQIKQAMGFRQFLLRGLAKVKAEWQLVCLAHNLRKLITAAV